MKYYPIGDMNLGRKMLEKKIGKVERSECSENTVESIFLICPKWHTVRVIHFEYK